MTRLHLTLLWFIASALLCACGDSASSTSEADASGGSQASTSTEVRALPLSTMQRLVDSVDYVDYLFYEYDFSMSMDQGQGIGYAIATIGEQAAIAQPNCKPIGRIFYEIQGSTAASAQLYFSPGCSYLEFLDDQDRVMYINEISPVGKDFLNQQFAQIIKDFVRVE